MLKLTKTRHQSRVFNAAQKWKNHLLTPSSGQPRPCTGSFLIEAIIACLIAAVVSTALIGSYAKINALSVQSQSQLTATGIANECIDYLRFLQFSQIKAAAPSTHYVMVNDTTNGAGPFDNCAGPILFTHPLLRDGLLTYYNQGGVSDQKNLFHSFSVGGQNTVEVDLTPGVIANEVQVTVIVNWTDNTGTHKYTTQTILTNFGLNG